MKKSVKFEEPEKENIAPPAATKAKGIAKSTEASTGLRARPVRRPAAATASRTVRTTRVASTSEGEEKPKPLSPKKISQMTLNCADSDDELAMDDQDTLRPMMRGSIKPPASTVKPSNLPFRRRRSQLYQPIKSLYRVSSWVALLGGHHPHLGRMR